LKWKYDKIDGLGKTTKESSLSLILGTAVHSALEFVYKQRTNLKTPHIDQMLQRYEAVFKKECKETTTEFLDEEIATFRERGQTYLSWYWSVYYPFDQAITMAVEQSFSIKLNEQISFSGYIDRIDVDGDRLILIDYKTSKQLEPDDADTHRQQLTLYALGMQQKYGSKFTTIEACLIYVHLQKEVRRTVTVEDLNNVTTRYLENAQRIDAAKERYTREPNNPDIFPAIVGKHCDYCPFQMICPQRKHHYMDDEMITSELGEKTIKSLIDQYGVLSKQLSALEKEKKTIAQIIVEYATHNHLEKVYGNERQTSLQSRTYWSVVAEFEKSLRTYAKHHDLVEELIKTDTNALAKLINEQKIDLTEIEGWISSKESTRL
jgi:RecB family exonuclease